MLINYYPLITKATYRRLYTHSGDEGFFKVYMVSIPLLCFKKSSNNKQDILFSDACHVSRHGARKSSQAQQTRDDWRKERSKIDIVSRNERFPIVSGLTFIILILKKSNLYMTRNTKFHVKVLLSLFF